MRGRSAAGTKKCWWPALAAAAVLLLSAPQALASRTASQRPELLASPALQPITATPALAPTYIPQGFALHLDTDPHPATFALFDDLAPASERVEPEKLASGVESWDLTPNLQRIQTFVTDSRWCREFLGPIDSPNLYQAFGLDPMNMTDPLGLCGWWSDTPCMEEIRRGWSGVKASAQAFLARFNRGTGEPSDPEYGEASGDVSELTRQQERTVDAGRAFGEAGSAVGDTVLEVAPTGVVTGAARTIQEARAGNIRGALVEAAFTAPDLIPGLGLVDDGVGAVRKLSTAGTRFKKAAAVSADAGNAPAHSAVSRDVASAAARLWQYPKAIDLRTGRAVPFPTGELRRVDKADRVLRAPGAKERGDFIAEWYRRGYETPVGGWENYQIHHIRPLEFGGTHDFWDMVPVPVKTHKDFNNFWRSYPD